MKSKTDSHAFLILTDCVSASMMNLFAQIKSSTISYGDTLILFHNKTGAKEKSLEGYDTYEFTDSVLHDLDYSPIYQTLTPGSNHFPVLQFYLDNKQYDYYWCIEDDVTFSGVWGSFFNKIIKKIEFDFISSIVSHYSEKLEPTWPWWDNLSKNQIKIAPDDAIRSFNPIYGISNKALSFLDRMLKSGWKGHHEVLIPTLLSQNNFLIKDFGGTGSFINPEFTEHFYTDRTQLWRPPFQTPGKLINKIYHPVKERHRLTDTFKYKISFCINEVGRMSSLKKTLIKNLSDNEDYENYEFLIFDNYRGEIELWLQEKMSHHLESGKVVYFKSCYRNSQTVTRAKNLSFKLASGDIICDWSADEYTGKNFSKNINEIFKSNTKIVLVSDFSQKPSKSGLSQSNSRIFCIKKDDFLESKGFDECREYDVQANMDLMQKLEFLRIKAIPINQLGRGSQFKISKKHITTRYNYINLNRILIHHISPTSSIVIFMYNNGTVETGTIQKTFVKRDSDFTYSYANRNPIFDCKLLESDWRRGFWLLAEDDETLEFIIDGNEKLSFNVNKDHYLTIIDKRQAVFFYLTSIAQINILLNLHFRQSLSSNYLSSKLFHKNTFGKGVVNKNFNNCIPIIVD